MSGSGRLPHSERSAAIAAGVPQHPIRWLIGMLIADRPMSAAELGELVEMPADKVRRHLRAMRAAGAIESVGERRRRNTTEQIYTTRGDFLLTDEDLAAFSFEARRRIDAYSLRIAIKEATEALVTNPSRRALERTETCIARIPFQVDEEAWLELAQIHEDAFLRIIELRDRVAARLTATDVETFRASSILLCFDATVAP